MEIYEALLFQQQQPPPQHEQLQHLHHHQQQQHSSLPNYLKPDPNTPSKRGRGHPPKPKAPEPAGVVVAPPRPRGCPSKLRDLFPPPALSKKKSSSGSGRPRDRPQKKAKIAQPTAATSAPAAAAFTGPLKILFTSQIQQILMTPP